MHSIQGIEQYPEELLCTMNISVGFYLTGDLDTLYSSAKDDQLDAVCKRIEEALKDIVADVQIYPETFEVVD